MPNVFIIAGPNGAGKTTYAWRFLRAEIRAHEFVNADLIAAGLSPFAPMRATFDAGKIMLKRLRDLSARREDFAFETTLSGRGYASFLEELRQTGYRVRLDFLWVSDLEITRDRIRRRVVKGGHDVPDEMQRRRFHLGIRNLAALYRPLLDRWRLFDNALDQPHLVADEADGVFTVHDAATLAQIEQSAKVTLMPPQRTTTVQEAHAAKPAAETRVALRAMRMAWADAVLENLQFGLPVVHAGADGKVMHTPAEEFAPRARGILEANGEFLPEEQKPSWW